MNGNLYIVLGIERRASVVQIRKAYRRLARKHHPDINPGDRAAEERFREISLAYAVLSDPHKRGFYDEHGYYAEGIPEAPPEHRWDFSFRAGDDAGAEGQGFADLFADVFGRAVEGAAEVGRDVETQVTITFEESIRGVDTVAGIYRRLPCETCHGAGRMPGAAVYECGQCGGSGRFVRSSRHLSFSTACPSCAGVGRVAAACRSCRGDGRAVAHEQVRVRVPAGVNTGSRIRVAGKGNVDRDTGAFGDLYVVTHVTPHPFFRRVGDNIHCRAPITIVEAALGAKIRVPTVDGEALLKIPPGVQPGKTLRLRGKGAPSLRGEGMRGDQYVELTVTIPRIADERSKEILRELARLNPEDPRKDWASDVEQ